MARRSTEEIRAEIDRISAILRLNLEFLVSTEPDPKKADILRTGMSDLDGWTENLRAQGVIWSAILRGYEEALRGMARMPRTEALGAAWRVYYTEKTGRDFDRDATDPARLMRKILKRGRIHDAAEFRLLEGFLADADAPPLGPDEAARINALLTGFTPAPGDD